MAAERTAVDDAGSVTVTTGAATVALSGRVAAMVLELVENGADIERRYSGQVTLDFTPDQVQFGMQFRHQKVAVR